MTDHIEARLEALEVNDLYLQKTVDDLSAVVIQQGKEIHELKQVVTLLAEKLRGVASLDPFDPNERPPHY